MKTVSSQTYRCMHCDKEVEGVITYCCNQSDCGCMGLPVDPPVCSDCYETLFK